MTDLFEQIRAWDAAGLTDDEILARTEAALAQTKAPGRVTPEAVADVVQAALGGDNIPLAGDNSNQ